jgi:hypothetical protein
MTLRLYSSISRRIINRRGNNGFNIFPVNNIFNNISLSNINYCSLSNSKGNQININNVNRYIHHNVINGIESQEEDSSLKSIKYESIKLNQRIISSINNDDIIDFKYILSNEFNKMNLSNLITLLFHSTRKSKKIKNHDDYMLSVEQILQITKQINQKINKEKINGIYIASLLYSYTSLSLIRDIFPKYYFLKELLKVATNMIKLCKEPLNAHHISMSLYSLRCLNK